MLPLTVGFLLNGQPAIAQSATSSSFLAQHSTPQSTAVLYVNPLSGNDSTADGSERSPFKTITRALDAAEPNTTIQLAPGIYSRSTGEVFPIALKPRVTIQGNPDTRGQDVVISGGGDFTSPILALQNITILGGANQATLAGVTVINPNPSGYALQIESSSPKIMGNTFSRNARGGIVIVGNSTSTILNNFFSQNGESSIRIQGTARPTVQENIIEQSKAGIVVSDAAAPILWRNRITQNKTGILLEGQSQAKLRGNSVEGNAEYGLQAIAQARPDLESPANEEANFFRNNGKQDIALPVPTSPTATSPKPAPDAAKATPKPSAAVEPASPPPAQDPVAQESVPAPPRAQAEPGSVVVPVVTIPMSQSVPVDLAPRRAPETSTEPPSFPAIAPVPPASMPPLGSPSSRSVPPSNAVPQANATSHPGLTSSAFPVPAALSNAEPTPTPVRPIQVMQVDPSSDGTINSAPDLAAPVPLATVAIPSKPRSKPVPPPLSSSINDNPAGPVISTSRRISKPVPSIPTAAEAIPAPPSIVPRPAVISQPFSPSSLPVIRPPSSAAAFPVPSGFRPTTTPQAMPIPVPQAIPVPVPQAMPTPKAQPLPSQPVPLNPSPPQAIDIPVPRPEGDRLAPVPIKVPRAPLSPAALPPVATRPASAKPTTLLPVPSASIPIGNIGDMPKVYTARGGNPQLIPGFPMNPPNAASVVVKYRVVVVAVDETQQEQVRAIIPDAFPVVYRGQRVLQAGAFGDRAKADQLVASLNTQGLQAIIEPME
jgi:parallel beta-helix repeat protein